MWRSWLRSTGRYAGMDTNKTQATKHFVVFYCEGVEMQGIVDMEQRYAKKGWRLVLTGRMGTK